MMQRWKTGVAALALVPLISGCVAVAALPVLAGGALVAGETGYIRAATPNPAAPRSSRSRAPRAAQSRPRPPQTPESAGALPGVVLTGLTELPKPQEAASGPNPWRQFIAYALDKARSPAPGVATSALLAPATSLASRQRRPCTASTPAVILDLDPEAREFGPASGASAPAALREGLASLRNAGVVPLWITRRPSADVVEVARALKDSGLDPDGRDPLLLARSDTDRKQLLREEANDDVCVIALAGDQKSDFDELFEYLRDPNSAAGLDLLLDAGWFIVPPPLE